MSQARSQQNAVLALFLFVPAASLGIAAKLYFAGEVGQLLFVLTRIWLLVLPLLWFVWVDRAKFSLPLPSRRELVAGTALGLIMFGTVLVAYWMVGPHWINPTVIRAKARETGISSLTVYLIFAFYFTVINSLIEEYVWRWFTYQKCEVLLPGTKAIGLAALCFTFHHIIVLAAYTGSWLVTIVGSFGVFVAGAVWSWCYLTYRSLWSCYICHLLADLAIALVGWHILFL